MTILLGFYYGVGYRNDTFLFWFYSILISKDKWLVPMFSFVFYKLQNQLRLCMVRREVTAGEFENEWMASMSFLAQVSGKKYKRPLAISKDNSVPAICTSNAGASAGGIEKDDTVIVKGIRQHPLASNNSQFRYYFFILALEEQWQRLRQWGLAYHCLFHFRHLY